MSNIEESWGIVFHSACWDILLAAAPPHPVDLRILEKKKTSYPYTPDYVKGAPHVTLIRDRRDSLAPDVEASSCNFCGCNPLDIPEITALMEECHKLQQKEFNDSTNNLPNLKLGTHQQRDRFASLPVEVTDMIFCLPPSKDVYNFKLASRMAASPPLSPSFWASRFQYGLEYSYFFEIRELLENRPSLF